MMSDNIRYNYQEIDEQPTLGVRELLDLAPSRFEEAYEHPPLDERGTYDASEKT